MKDDKTDQEVLDEFLHDNEKVAHKYSAFSRDPAKVGELLLQNIVKYLEGDL